MTEAATSSAPTPFVFEERVRFGHLDALRHLNNVEYLRFFETARVEYLGRLLPSHDIMDDPERAGLILAETQIEYKAPGRFDDVIRIALQPERLRRSSFRIFFEMRADPGDRLLARGYSVSVGYDYAAGRPAPLPPETVKILRAAGAEEEGGEP
jgi:acyl-CoA thioester hydrolase